MTRPPWDGIGSSSSGRAVWVAWSFKASRAPTSTWSLSPIIIRALGEPWPAEFPCSLLPTPQESIPTTPRLSSQFGIQLSRTLFPHCLPSYKRWLVVPFLFLCSSGATPVLFFPIFSGIRQNVYCSKVTKLLTRSTYSMTSYRVQPSSRRSSCAYWRTLIAAEFPVRMSSTFPACSLLTPTNVSSIAEPTPEIQFGRSFRLPMAVFAR